MVPQAIIAELQRACAESEQERCGLVDSENRIHFISNVSPIPQSSFVFDKREYFTLRKTIQDLGGSVRCIFHTHPGNSCEPSEADVASTRRVGFPSLVVTQNSYRWISA